MSKKHLSLPLALVSAALLLIVTATTALAWTAPVLEAECAPDENSFAWTITLAEEDDYNIEFSWDGFTTVATNPAAMDFGSAGEHQFTTVRGGTSLSARFVSDTNASTTTLANSELCEEPGTDLTLIKKDQDHEPMAGIMFNLAGGEGYDQDGTTGADGSVTFTDLTEGEYTLTETGRPDNCTNDGPWTVKVEKKEIGVANDNEGDEFEITIKDKNGMELESHDGAFKIVNTCTEPTPTPTPTPSATPTPSTSPSATPTPSTSPTATPKPLSDTALSAPGEGDSTVLLVLVGVLALSAGALVIGKRSSAKRD